MQRVVILGVSGAGKSTLARALGGRTGLPVVHLDVHFYKPGWVAREAEDFRDRVAAALAGDRWIADGIFVGLAGDLTLARADLILWVEQPRWLSLWRATTRWLANRRRRRSDLPPQCFDSLETGMLSFIWNFERLSRPRIEAAITARAPATPLRRLCGDRQVQAFLAKLDDGVK